MCSFMSSIDAALWWIMNDFTKKVTNKYFPVISEILRFLRELKSHRKVDPSSSATAPAYPTQSGWE